MKRTATAFIIIFTLVLLISPVFAESSNLALNPSFEEKDAGSPYFWSSGSWEDSGKFSLDESISHTGKNSVCITNEKPTDSRYKQQINVKGSTYYKLSCWVRTENAGKATKGANISIDGLLDTSTDIKGTTSDWTYTELYGVTDTAQQSFVLTLGLGGYSSLNSGKAWFDDVSIEELSAAPADVSVVKLYKSDAPADESRGGSNYILLVFIAAFLIILVIIAVFIYKENAKKKTKGIKADKNKDLDIPQLQFVKMKLDKKDFIIMAAMTAVYLVIALLNLGSLSVPESSWTPARQGESIVLDLGKEITTGKIFYYSGLGQSRPGEGKYRIQYKDSSGAFVPLATIEKTSGSIFLWKYAVTPEVKARYIKLIVDAPGGTLNELAFFQKGSTTALDGIKILERDTGNQDEGNVENLFDEAYKVDYKHTYLTGMIFDEIYHARTAYEYLHGMDIYEWTHPPLGKLLISIGIAVFGMVPFGWRIIGTLFGAAMIPIMYLFGRKLFNRKFYAFCTAFLMMFDFMHFGLSRIATIDVYGTFFVILMYYFMYDYFVNKSYVLGFKKSLAPLLLSGICFGLGAASKWIGLYAGGGLALLFFLTKYSEYRDYRTMSASKKKAAWYDDFIPLYISRTFLYCVLFFVIIPAVIYVLSYVPGLLNGSYENAGYILQNQASMLKYHSKDVLTATHPFSSYFWEWPLMARPLETYAGSDLPAGMSSTMTIMGNPAIWWVGIIAIALAISIAIRKRDRKMLVVFAAIAFQYLPWWGVTRIVFIYHFFSSVPFMILAIVYIIKELLEDYPKLKYVVYSYLAVVMLLFIMFYPVLSGMEVSRGYVEHFLLWFKDKWVF